MRTYLPSADQITDRDETVSDSVVHYLGPIASFSHQAAINAFGATHPSDLIPQPTFAEIFNAVQSSSNESQHENKTSKTVYGVVPFENSSNGSVVQLLDLLADRDDRYTDVTVCGEYYLPVHHYLLIKKAPAVDGDGNEASGKPFINGQNPDPPQTISQILTHPQVWGQCTTFLSQQHLQAAERIDVGSTSLAALKVHQTPDRNTAAIASRLAAEVNGLDVLAANIEDQGNNTTRFFVLRKITTTNTNPDDDQDGPTTTEDHSVDSHGTWKSLISFTIDHASPGALADALAVFKAFDFNLTSIYTRPSRQQPWHYIFFVECAETRRAGDDVTDHDRRGMMMKELERHTARLRMLGRWRDRSGMKE